MLEVHVLRWELTMPLNISRSPTMSVAVRSKNAQKSLFAAGSLGKIAGLWSSGMLTFHWVLVDQPTTQPTNTKA